jgi:hypothetical protein
MAPEISPPSFPMNPFDMGLDLYEPHPVPDATVNGLRRKAPYQYGTWVLQPHYKGIIFMIDTISKQMFMRTLQPVGSTWYPEKLLRAFDGIKFLPEVRWLHCVRVAPFPNNLLNYAAVVLDFVHPTLLHAARRDILKQSLPELGIRQLPEGGKVYLAPEFPEENFSPEVWAGLQLMNTEWGRNYYDGVVVKQASARYHVQKFDHQIQSMRWHLHKFLSSRDDSNASKS